MKLANREEKSLRHVVMVATFLDDNKPKTLLKKWNRTVSNFIDVNYFHLICQMFVKLSGVDPRRQYVSLEKENFCIVFNFFIKRAREIRNFHVDVVQRRLRKIQNSVMHVQSC